ncbi:ATP-binding cassette domain-containing protein [Bradyrhizobium genosp. P]|uniref:ATP-binding cassette domain-containing protein n=1 Tax=Bradyrhizobium genosp. P TaxID=83641 RepID=UPI003CF1A603
MAFVSVESINENSGQMSVFRGVLLSTADGEFLMKLGPSGCGKSRLLRILAGLEMQGDAGSVSIDERSADELRPKRSDVATRMTVASKASPLDIYANPDDQHIAEFIGSASINMLDGVMHKRGLIDISAATLTIRPDTLSGASPTTRICPETTDLADNGGQSVLPGSVHMIEHIGADLFVHFDLAGIDHPFVARLLAERAPPPNHSLHFEVRSARASIYMGQVTPAARSHVDLGERRMCEPLAVPDGSDKPSMKEAQASLYATSKAYIGDAIYA